MPILVRFILKEFWKSFLTIFLVFTGLYFFADLIANLNILFKYDAKFSAYLFYSLLKIFEGLYFIIPIVTLTSSMFLFGTLSKNFEIISFRTLRVSKKYFIIPLVFSGLIIAFFSFMINEYIFPKTNYYAKYFRAINIEKKTSFAVSKSDNIWYHKKNYIVRIKFLVFDAGIMNDITILKFDKNFNLIERIDADYGYKKNKNNWELVNAVKIDFKNGIINKFVQKLSMPMPLKLNEADFFVIEQKTKNLNIFKLIKLIKTMKKNNIDIKKYIVEVENKIFYPFVSIIFILLGFYLNIKEAKSGVIVSIILAIILGAGYFIINGFFVSLSKIEKIPYFMGPIIPLLIYSFILMILNKKTRY